MILKVNSVLAFLKTIFAFLKMLLEGKFSFSENVPHYKFTLLSTRTKQILSFCWGKGSSRHFLCWAPPLAWEPRLCTSKPSLSPALARQEPGPARELSDRTSKRKFLLEMMTLKIVQQTLRIFRCAHPALNISTIFTLKHIIERRAIH